ncbi:MULTISPECIES: amidohydrolase family protein [unclassified Streptomyces]|uniref:amidohydrolase family protein n=1 Tax=unclassified Streptomyces TaxID=2593676 RepID=UPI00037EA304|nr:MULTISPECIES: amidohydrolase family protein [unclassified Streptomyces]MYY04451.1 amidohydrolase family protein [Streptomyces sp. SID4913]
MQTQQRDLVIAGARVFDGRSEQVAENQGVWVSGDRIRRVGPVDEVLREASTAADPRVLDAAGATVVPGLINMHVHLDLALPGDLARVAMLDDPALALHMAEEARLSLLAGVTSVRLTGTYGHIDFALRDSIDSGRTLGPRIFTAGQLVCSTGGHGWQRSREADGPAGFAAAVRDQIKHGADFIKLSLSGGMAGEHEKVTTSQLRDDELDAVLEIAHAWGRKVTAHAGPAIPTMEAIRRGLDCVEHGYELTDELCRLMVERGVTYVPTITVTRCREFFDRHRMPVWMQDRALAWGDRHWESLETAIRHGVSIALGSDMPPHAEFDGTSATVRELEFMVQAGMTPHAALTAATSTGADWLGKGAMIGCVREGAFADLLLVAGDPLADISAMRELSLIVKGGRTVLDQHA